MNKNNGLTKYKFTSKDWLIAFGQTLLLMVIIILVFVLVGIITMSNTSQQKTPMYHGKRIPL